MQLTEYVETLGLIVGRLDLLPLRSVLSEMLRPNNHMSSFRDRFVKSAMRAQGGMQELSNTPEVKRVMEELGLFELFEPTLVAIMLTAVNVSNSTDDLFKNRGYCELFLRLHGSVEELLRFYHSLQSLIKSHFAQVGKEEKTLDFEIIDPSNSGITVDRFVGVLHAIVGIHSAVSAILDVKINEPIIVALDSGSNSLITIKSDGRVIDSVRKLITQMWNHVRFRKAETLEKNFETASKAIDLLERVEEKERNKSIDAETAKRLKHDVTRGVLELFESGTTIKEIHKTITVVDNRALLERISGVKLIGPGDPPHAPLGASIQLPPPVTPAG